MGLKVCELKCWVLYAREESLGSTPGVKTTQETGHLQRMGKKELDRREEVEQISEDE